MRQTFGKPDARIIVKEKRLQDCDRPPHQGADGGYFSENSPYRFVPSGCSQGVGRMCRPGVVRPCDVIPRPLLPKDQQSVGATPIMALDLICYSMQDTAAIARPHDSIHSHRARCAANLAKMHRRFRLLHVGSHRFSFSFTHP
jgi:hypothetical protein